VAVSFGLRLRDGIGGEGGLKGGFKNER